MDTSQQISQAIQIQPQTPHPPHLQASNNSAINNSNNNSNQSAIDEHKIQIDDDSSRVDDDIHNSSSVESAIKTPNSYKYPLLKRYYEFGPWVGRNRKAVCLGCRLQTSSSQPDRLLKHLNKCSALSDADKMIVQDLMNERTANRRKKPMQLKLKRELSDNGTAEYYSEADQNQSMTDDLAISSINTSQSCLAIGGDRLRREHPDRNSRIDEALTRYIMMCRIPLKAIHSPEFIEFCRALNPDYHIPSRETITNVLIPGLLNII